MNIKGFTLSLDRTDVIRDSRSHTQGFMITLSALAVLLAAATIFFSLSAVKPDVSSGVVVGGSQADAARWSAMGEYYRANALETERSAAASSARWEAIGKQYRAEAFDIERSAAANNARWEAMGEHYKSATFDIDRYVTTNTARWDAMGAYYTVGNNDATEAYSARYQAMGEWYTRQK